MYALDKDNNADASDDQIFIRDVEKYCATKGYSLIWFVNRVEDVFNDGIKKHNPNPDALSFYMQKKIKKIDKKNLSAPHNVNKRGKSNFLTVLREIKELLYVF